MEIPIRTALANKKKETVDGLPSAVFRTEDAVGRFVNRPYDAHVFELFLKNYSIFDLYVV